MCITVRDCPSADASARFLACERGCEGDPSAVKRVACNSVLECVGEVCRADLWRVMEYFSEVITGSIGRK